MDLVEFLRARLDEVWEVAQRENTYPHGKPISAKDWEHVAGEADSMLVGMFSPAHVLADVAAKRRIVEEIAPTVEGYDDQITNEWGGSNDGTAAKLLGLLALVYAEHPDYQPEWKP